MDELLDDAFLRAIGKLDKLKDPRHFVSWVKRFVFYRAKELKRDFERRAKLGTPTAPEVIIQLSDMIGAKTEWTAWPEADRKYLLDALAFALRQVDSRCRPIGRWMHKSFEKNGEAPSVRAIAEAMATSQGNAERCRKQVHDVWQPICRALGFHA